MVHFDVITLFPPMFDAVTGGTWERGLFALIRREHPVFEQLPGYAHEALVAAHLRKGTRQGYRPGVLETEDGTLSLEEMYTGLLARFHRGPHTNNRVTTEPPVVEKGDRR